jgi:PleD family two-component response regulator
VGASIGLVIADAGTGEPAQLLARADQAMYEAKRAGKCQVRAWRDRRPAA